MKQELALIEGQSGPIYPGAFQLSYLPPFGLKDVKTSFIFWGWFAGYPLNKGIFECDCDIVDNEILCFCEDKPYYSEGDFPYRLCERIEHHYGRHVSVVKVAENGHFALLKYVEK